MKKTKKILIDIIIIGLLVNTVGCNKQNSDENEMIKSEHRRQSWLKSINWDSNRLNYSGENIRVAVIDSGVDLIIPELKGKIESEIEIVKENQESDIKHGTAVSSIIAAESHSMKQVEGIACNSKLISIDVTNRSDGVVKVDNLIDGINKAIECKVDIINISVGCLSDSKELEGVIKKAWSNDIMIVASAGNYTNDNILYPSKYEDVLAVGAVDKKGNILYPKGKTEKKVLFFPGEKIVSALGNGEYAGCEGTSFSTAICTGLVALLLEKKNDKRAVKTYLEKLDLSNGVDFKVLIENYE